MVASHNCVWILIYDKWIAMSARIWQRWWVDCVQVANLHQRTYRRKRSDYSYWNRFSELKLCESKVGGRLPFSVSRQICNSNSIYPPHFSTYHHNAASIHSDRYVCDRLRRWGAINVGFVVRKFREVAVSAPKKRWGGKDFKQCPCTKVSLAGWLKSISLFLHATSCLVNREGKVRGVATLDEIVS